MATKQTHLQAIISAVDRLSPTLAKIGVSTARTKALLTTLNSVNFNRMRGTLNMVNKSVADVGSAARGTTDKLLPLVGLGAVSFAGLGVGFLGAARGAMQYSANLQDTAEMTGLTVTELQLLQGAFRMGGVDAEAATDAIVKFNKGMSEGASGKDKGFAGLMTRLRIPMRDAKGQIRSLTDVMPELSDAFEKNTNPAVRTRIAMELFGKSGSKLIGTMAQGGKSLRELFTELEASGRVLGGPAIGRLDKLDENLEELGVRYRVLSADILSRAAPAMQKLVERMQGWISANREVISQRLGDAIEKVANSITEWINNRGIEELTKQLRLAWKVAGEFVNRLGGLAGVAKLLGVLILAGPVASLVALGAAFARLAIVVVPLFIKGLALLGGPLAAMAGLALRLGGLMAGALATGLRFAAQAVLVLGRALLLNPIGLAVTVIAGAAFLIWKNWATLGPKFKEMWEGIKATLSSTLDSIVGVWQGAWDRIKAVLAPLLEGAERAMAAAKRIASVLPNFAEQGSPEGVRGFNGETYAPSPQRQVPSVLQQPTSGASPLILNQTSPRIQGEMRVRFENAPPGTRVEPGKTNAPGLNFNPDVGYRMMGGLG